MKANDVLIGRVDSDTTIPAKIRLTIGAVNLSSGGNVTILPNIAGLGGDLLIQNAKSSIVSGQSFAIGDATNRAVNAFVSGVFTAAADLRIATLDGLSVSGKITSTGGSIRLAADEDADGFGDLLIAGLGTIKTTVAAFNGMTIFGENIILGSTFTPPLTATLTSKTKGTQIGYKVNRNGDGSGVFTVNLKSVVKPAAVAL